MAETPHSLPLPPGRFGLPWIGETLQFLRDPQFANKRHQKYGAIFKTRILGRPTVVLRTPEANRFVLTNENQYFVVAWPPSTKRLLGPLALAVQTGEEHKKRRQILAQAFQPRALAGYIQTMEQITQRHLQQWVQQGRFAWYPRLRSYTFDVACKLLIGLDAASKQPLGQWFETWCEGLFTIPLALPWTKFGRAWRCRHLLLAELEKTIRQRQQEANPGNDALGLLLQAQDDQGNRLSIEELKDQVLLLLFAGHETLTSALASFCLLLAQHPQVRDRVRAELQQFPSQSPLTLEQLKQMHYLEQVLQEVLRFIPPVGGGFRQVIRPCAFQGYQIPQGWSVLYQISQTHRDRALYPQPEQFDPDRFDPQHPERAGKPFSYLPFGGGLRECLGKEFARLEMKVFAVHLVRGYDWELLPGQDLEMAATPTPHPRDGLQVQLRSLENAWSGTKAYTGPTNDT